MSKQFSAATYVKYFLIGCLLAVAGIGVYTLFAGSSPEEQQAAQASAAPTQAAPSETASDETSGSEDASALPVVTVYKSPTCGCCAQWAEHMEVEGFPVKTRDLSDVTPKKNDLGVPVNMRSCHTATVGDYAIEGHVPAADVKRLLAERPDVTGLTVPGMPIGSPGMEMPGRAPQAYQVYAFAEGRATGVFAQH